MSPVEKIASHIMSFDWLPFTLLGTSGETKVNKARIVEALIIALVGGIVAGYIAVVRMDVKLEYLEKAIVEIKADVKDIRRGR